MGFTGINIVKEVRCLFIINISEIKKVLEFPGIYNIL